MLDADVLFRLPVVSDREVIVHHPFVHVNVLNPKLGEHTPKLISGVFVFAKVLLRSSMSVVCVFSQEL